MSELREKFLRLSGRRFAAVEIPGFGPLRVRSLNEGERARVEEAAADPKRIKRVILIESLCENESEAPLFTEADFDLLSEMDGAVVDRVAAAALKLSEFAPADIQALLGELVAS